MQPTAFKTILVFGHYIMALEGTNNLVFRSAHTVPIHDKKIVFDDKTRLAMDWPESIRTMYDYRARVPQIYNRLYQLCFISLCSDIEFFFKSLFEERAIPRAKDRGFFQRFEHVIAALEKHGCSFAELSSELAALKQAFDIRHMCTHNFGAVDEAFAKESTRPATVGEFYMLGQDDYLPMFDAYVRVLLHIDGWLLTP